MLTVVEENR